MPPRPRSTPWYTKLQVLLWKNWLLRKRHWLLTALEVILPSLLFGILVLARTLPSSSFLPSMVTEPTTFEVRSETILRGYLCQVSGGKLDLALAGGCDYQGSTVDRRLVYGPPGDLSSDIVTRVVEDIGFGADNVYSVGSNKELNEFIQESYLQNNADNISESFYVGVFFDMEMKTSGVLPKKLNYDLRLPKSWYTNEIYPSLQISGPRAKEPGDFGDYNYDGFLILQALIDRHYIEIASKDDTFSENNLIESQMYPYPPYLQDFGANAIYGFTLPTFMFLAFVLLSPSLIKSIVYEKETGVKELVLLMGLPPWMIWLGWFLYSIVIMIINVAIVTILVKIEVPVEDVMVPAILQYTNWSIVFLFLLLYGISSIAFCCAISCFFSRPTLATTIGVLAWLLSYFIPKTMIEANYNDLPLTPKLFACLLPNMALDFFFKVVTSFEGRAKGATWQNLWEHGNTRDVMTIGWLFIMIVIDIILYSAITWYFDQTLPGIYGVPKPWLFPFQKSYWISPKPAENGDSKASDVERSDNGNFEYLSKDAKSGVLIENLRKEFPALGGKTKVAVEDVSLNCYEGQCTVLLGHNGAGKTTTMSVITGMYQPTSGQAYIKDYSINTNLKEARSFLGLCPQHNTLFTDLSVSEHLIFFAVLKGLTWKEASTEAASLMEKMQLSSKVDQYGNQLSGGMKRKLCLCIALIGGSEVVILDEPSSGLDPESRRWVWDTVLAERGRRTVLVTTHHMEEADVLGDRVAVMSGGRVVCAGSSLFLKKKFGDGYNLRILPGANFSQQQEVTKTIEESLPGAALTSTSPEELIYNLPSNTKLFGHLLSDLSDKKQALNINHVGLSITTMEQVFLNVGNQFDKNYSKETETKRIQESVVDLTVGSSAEHLTSRNEGRLQGFKLIQERIKALFMKRIIYTKRKWVLLITQGLLPVIVTLFCLLVDLFLFTNDSDEAPIDLSLDMFASTQSFVQSDAATDKLALCYTNTFTDPYRVAQSDNVTATLLTDAPKDIAAYRENYVTSAEFASSTTATVSRMLFQSIPYHSPGVGMNILGSALLQCATGDESLSIGTRNYPLPMNPNMDMDQTSANAILYSNLMPIALAFLSASFAIFPLQERTSKAKQVQLMTGTPASFLWFTTFLWDYLAYTISAVVVLICFVAVNPKGTFVEPGVPGSLFLMLFIYGWAALPMAYVFSFLFETSASGFSVLALINIITGLILSLATQTLAVTGSDGLVALGNWLDVLASFVPSYPISYGFKKLIDVSTYNGFCDTVSPDLLEGVCESIYSDPFPNPFKACCSQCKTDPITKCFEERDFLSMEDYGLGSEMVWLFCDGVFYFIILSLIESRVSAMLRNVKENLQKKIRGEKKLLTFNVPQDEDVIKESKITQALFTESSPSAALLVNNLCKDFYSARLRAVSDVSFRVGVSECFGLLGVNGAGKTTTFRMLTGDETPTAGDARIGTNTLRGNKNKFVKEIGYCPQFDAILDELTGEEMLHLMGSLRGIRRSDRTPMVRELIELVDLTECYWRQTSTYSGGNKRKLSTALALIGEPSMVFLDEPTTGVDPASRRRVWSAVQAGRERGQSIILTSHSMDECEALCSRIVILVRGQIRCTGSPSYLKAKFGNGFSLQVKLRSNYDKQELSEEKFQRSLKELQESIAKMLPGSRKTDEHRGMLTYLVPSGTGWARLFQAMEELQEGDDSLVEDYAASDPSLEQVFLMFAREEQASWSATQGGPQPSTLQSPQSRSMELPRSISQDMELLAMGDDANTSG